MMLVGSAIERELRVPEGTSLALLGDRIASPIPQNTITDWEYMNRERSHLPSPKIPSPIVSTRIESDRISHLTTTNLTPIGST
jgi:hypothetical protein